MHVGKNHSDFECVNGVVDAWDEHISKETMKKSQKKSTSVT